MISNIKHIVFLIFLILSGRSNAQLTNDATYHLSVKFDQGGYTYSDENSLLKISQGWSKVILDFKMTDPKTASTNYVHVEGEGSGTADKNKFSASGSGNIITFEKDKEDSRLHFSFSMNGEFSSRAEESLVLGNFILNDESTELTGRVSGNTELGKGHTNLTLTRGSFKIKKQYSNEWVTGTSGIDFEPGDKIESGSDTRINLTFPDGSIFKIKSNSVVSLRGRDEIEVEVGELYFKIGKQGMEFQVITPSYVIGDLGTEFFVTVDGAGNTDVSVVSGSVYIKDNAENKVILRKGEHVRGSNSAGIGTVSSININEIITDFEATDDPVLNRSEEPVKVQDLPNENSGNIAGTYDFAANNYKGMLEFSSDMKSGRIFFDISNKWEEITNLTFNTSTGEVNFTRPWAGNPNFQRYSGKISGNKITGVFTDVNYGSQEFIWEALKK